jgi:hypothetical protein
LASPESVVMAVRTARTSEKSRNRWGQIGISACVLLLPPIAIGAAATAMLVPRQDTAARDAAPAAQSIAIAVTAETVPAFERDAALAQPPLPEPLQPGPALPPPAAGKPGAAPAPAPGGAGTYSLASAGQEPAPQAPRAPQAPQAPQAGKDMARLMGPVPVHVTVVVAPNAGHAEATQTEPPAGEAPPPPRPPPATPAESPPVPPAMLAGLPPVPPERPAGFAADVSAEARTARSSRLPSHTPIIRQPPHRQVHHAARAARSPPQPTAPFSALRSWLQQLGSPPRAAQRG